MVDGITNTNRVDTTTERKLYAKVVDNVLSSATLSSRLQGNGKPFIGKTFDYTVKITDSALGEFFSGLESLSSAASDTTITLSYAHTAFAQPIVLPMLESFANSGPTQTIDLDMFKYEEAVAEAVSRMGTAAFGTGSGEQPLGLGAIVDDATDVSSIGGQSRSTYTGLKATRTASGGTLTLSKLATLDDTISASGVESESPTLHVTTKTVWSLYEQLLSPAVRAEYASIGYNALGVRGDAILKSRADLKGAAGFTALTYRGVPVVKDDKCTAQNWFMLNERYLEWRGRSIVPAKFAGQIEKVDLGTPSTVEGVAAAPSKFNGWFMQKAQMMPNQAGMIGRLYVIGQMCTSQPRRHGRLTGVTGV
jgi:hypothetical protein